MPAPFKRLTLDQFANLLNRYQFTRKINAVHMHHTWRPNHSQFRGHESIVGMWTYHTQTNKWSDIAQHITIDPQGYIWLGRNWNAAPASASGQNGDSHAGPFMFEMIGDFDKGCDPFDGPQRNTVIKVIALVQKRFGLAPGSLMFHNMMSGKSCPGSSIDYREILAEVQRVHDQPEQWEPRSRSAIFADEAIDDPDARTIDEAVEDLGRVSASQRDPENAEACVHTRGAVDVDAGALPAGRAIDLGAARRAGPTPAQLAALRPHLVNLTMGELSDEGEYKTSKGDVDAIFGEHLEAAFRRAQALELPLRIVVQAHGGLVNEAAGLAIAQKSVDWWMANNIYPLYFVWETGAFETIGQLLRRVRDGATRGVPRDVFDLLTDPLVEEAVRALQGQHVWGAMKLSAQRASALDVIGNGGEGDGRFQGGACYVAQKLRDFCRLHREGVELHAVGHSAGAIFQAYFIPRVLQFGAGPFQSVHLMAPAIRTDLFKATLARFVGPGKPGIEQMAMYTMRKDYELDDNCAGIYRKSLLYLIHHALEPQRRTPLLGLEENLRADRELIALFGLDGKPPLADVVWSKTAAEQGRSASRSSTHGGFDDDLATMGSIARRILARSDADRIVEYRPGADSSRGADAWNVEVALPTDILLRPAPAPLAAGGFMGEYGMGGRYQSNGGNGNGGAGYYHPGGGVLHAPEIGGGRRRALCVGINRYPTYPLTGCLADVEAWTRILGRLGFEDIATLLNEHATHDAILEQLRQLVQASRPGDVIVFQYAGHGTTVTDLGGDEGGGDTPADDEAICPVDYETGALILDDDIGRIVDLLPEGVNLTCFMDCCHSGTASRFGVGKNPSNTAHDPGDRVRFIVAGPELQNAHRRYRAGVPQGRTLPRGPARMREVLFAACLSSEKAWESRGQGEFTVRATGVLGRMAGSLGSISNADFARLVIQEFGPSPRQQPRLYSSEAAAALGLLAPLQAHAAAAASRPAWSGEAQLLIQGMQQLLQQYGPPH
ncbi:caspase family protein [Telluria aromaticivorans]|uniref:Peptidase C14 n=1 Tax=Telluria aromaticivorans TaxID=2725995 RepID=A0A7Y2NYG2_9BURK|nr:caspase family protein [Telluria aromaticivorans]NNG21969.1 peptidase C14 [Telluria aromaticivorans]